MNRGKIGGGGAGQTGAAQSPGKPTEAEQLSLNRHKHFMDVRTAWKQLVHTAGLRLKLKAAGFTRTANAIHLKLKRMSFNKGGEFYSANILAQALGIDPHAVTRWINAGQLKATFASRGERQNGDTYLMRAKDVRRCVLEHPSEIDLRKVDQRYFLDMLTYMLAQTA